MNLRYYLWNIVGFVGGSIFLAMMIVWAGAVLIGYFRYCDALANAIGVVWCLAFNTNACMYQPDWHDLAGHIAWITPVVAFVAHTIRDDRRRRSGRI